MASPKPVFVHCHGYDVTWDFRLHSSPETPFHPSTYLDAALRLGEKAILIANSRTTANRLLEAGIPEDHVWIKYLGVPVPDVPPCREPVSEGIQVLYLGRLVDFKGPDLTIKAFELACDHGLDGQLIMAGDGPLRAACERLRDESRFRERIHLTSLMH